AADGRPRRSDGVANCDHEQYTGRVALMHTQSGGVPTMPRAMIPYGRFSERRQEAGDSQRRQDAAIEAALQAEQTHGPIVLDTSYNLFDKGLSAYRGSNWKKGDLGKFLDLVKAGVIASGTVLAVERVSRFSRMTARYQTEQLLNKLLDAGIVIRFCDPP